MACQPLWRITLIDGTIELKCQQLTDEDRAVPLALRGLHFGPTLLGPLNHDLLAGLLRRLPPPSHRDATAGYGQCAVLDCVGRQLVDNHRQCLGGVGIEHNLRPLNLIVVN